MVEEKRTNPTELYDIISNRKFCATMQSKNSSKLRSIMSDNLSLFSDKQQRFLRSEDWAPNKQLEDGEDATATSRAPEPEEKKPAEKTSRVKDDKKRKDSDTKSAESTENAAGGWTWTVRDRPTTDANASKKKKSSTEDSEAIFEAMAEKNMAAQKQQEDAVDDSLALLERLNQQKVEEPPAASGRDRDRGRRDDTKTKTKTKSRKELSRSRSISAASASSSSRGRKKKKKKGGRSRSRGRGGSGGGSYEDALKRRMQQRESELETSRMPVVDPGHARKSWR